MDYVRQILAGAIIDEMDRRIVALRSVEPSDLAKAQGYLNGLEKGLSIINDEFAKLGSVEA